MLYYEKYLNGFYQVQDKSIKYYLINPLFLGDKELENVLLDLKTNEKKLENKEDQGFLNTKTIYKIREDI